MSILLFRSPVVTNALDRTRRLRMQGQPQKLSGFLRLRAQVEPAGPASVCRDSNLVDMKLFSVHTLTLSGAGGEMCCCCCCTEGLCTSAWFDTPATAA